MFTLHIPAHRDHHSDLTVNNYRYWPERCSRIRSVSFGVVCCCGSVLATKRETWENGNYKAASEDLYVLLDECVDLFKEVRAHRSLVKNAGNRVIIDVSKTPADNSNRIITEIIDCWLELRSIRKALEIEEEFVTLKIEQNISAFDQLMANIHECETEMHEDDAFYQLLKRGEVDTAILSFYNLDDEIRQAVL